MGKRARISKTVCRARSPNAPKTFGKRVLHNNYEKTKANIIDNRYSAEYICIYAVKFQKLAKIPYPVY